MCQDVSVTFLLLAIVLGQVFAGFSVQVSLLPFTDLLLGSWLSFEFLRDQFEEVKADF